MTASSDDKTAMKSTIRHGLSWADQMDSPGWNAKSSPKFDEGVPSIELDEQEYELKSNDRTVSTASSNLIPVYVGGLDYALEAKDLEDFFAAKSIRVNRIRIPKSAGKSRGCAFLNVYDQGALSAILKLNGSKLSGRAITVREDNGPTKPSRAANGVGSTKSSINRRTEERKSTNTSEETTERKKLELKPRTRPVNDTSTAASSTSSGIFGNAKPRDEFEYERRKEQEKKELKPKILSLPVVAPVVQVQKPVVSKKPTIKNRFSALESSDEDSM
jgi:RNA recognition motif-containing protein